MKRIAWMAALLVLATATTAHGQPCEVTRFEDLPLGASWTPGAFFTVAPGVDVAVDVFYFAPGPCVGGITSGFTEVQSGGLACRSGQEMAVNNVQLKFDYGMPVACVAIHFGEYGGTVSLSVNGDCIVVPDFFGLPPNLGGVDINVTPLGGNCGVIDLSGVVADVVIGGQELWIDDMRFCRGCRLNCPAGDGGIVNPTTAGNKSPDLDGNGNVGLVDFTMFESRFLSTSYCADFDCDGVVGLTDFTRFESHFLHSGTAGVCCQ